MNSRHKKTLAAIMTKPAKSSIVFADIEALIKALGGEVREGAGSRVVLELAGHRKYMHRPHPGKDAKKYQIDELRDWFDNLEVKP
ncbi:MAG: type II toxin-antitoxin system HicA family toxin [Thermodesulfovibrionales bacterium]